MLLPYFEVGNNIGAVVTDEHIIPTVAMWRIILSANRILLTDCTDHMVWVTSEALVICTVDFDKPDASVLGMYRSLPFWE